MKHIAFALILLAGAAVAAQDDGLVGMWKFDDGQGTKVTDSSPNGNNGAIVGGATWTTGLIGGALQFNGTDSWVDVPPSASLDLKSLTLAAWVNAEKVGGFMGFTMGTNWSDERAVVHFYDGQAPSSGNPLFTVSNGVRYVTVNSGAPLPLNKWVHVAVTYDGQNMSVYMDGKLMVARANADFPAVTKDVPLKIGRTLGLGPDLFTGKLDDVRVYNRALSADEIKKLAQQ